MTTRENLIPDDQEYGERQANRQQMQEAGLPTETPIATGQPAAPSAMPPADMGGGDVLTDMAPTRPLLDMPAPVDPVAEMLELARVSQNSFVREVILRAVGEQ